ncbi:hypothetical protein C3446_17690 [Escherichia coli]|nr:hypothetical protein C5O97_17015 [Escherichia coli]ROX08811.1 hypothetical protein C3446_17690 [Escherichia coli]
MPGCSGSHWYQNRTIDSKTVIVDEITRNAQFPLKARAITVNGNASQGTIEALINVIYTWQ